ncbi:MAG: hypothetical protein AAFV80_09340 [Bacteroidota bacterium]
MTRIVGLLGLLFVLAACSKEEFVLLPLEEIEATNFIVCHNEQTWTEAQVQDELNGEWVLRAVQNPLNGQVTSLVEDSVRIEFFSDQGIRLYEANIVEMELSYQLTDNGATSFVLMTQPTEVRVNGVIYLCDDLLTLVSFNPGGSTFYYQRD